MTLVSQRSFAAGEVSPYIYPRVDTVKYSTGLRTCRNSIVMRHGGTASRPGTTFVAEVRDSTAKVRLIPFVFNNDQTYVLELGLGYMRFHKQGAQITWPGVAITGITQSNPAVVTTATPHALSTGMEFIISGVAGMTEVDNRNFIATTLSATTLQLVSRAGVPVDSTGYGAYTSGGAVSKIYEIGTPYGTVDLPALKFIQSADVLTVSHPSYQPYELKRFSENNWRFQHATLGASVVAPSFSSITSGTGGSVAVAYAATSVTATGDESISSATSGGTAFLYPITITLSGAVLSATSYNFYKSATGNVGGPFGYVGSSTSTTFVDSGVTPDFTRTPPLQPSLFAASGDYPAAVAYFQQRLLFGGSNNAPATVWTSKTGIFHNFNTSNPPQASDAITFTLVSKQVNQIKHLIDVGNLVILTSGGEWVINADQSAPLTPSNVSAKQYSYNGSSDLTPIVVGTNVLFVQARGSIIRDLFYEFQSATYKGNDLTIFSSHLIDKWTLTDWAYQQVPHSIVWAVRSDGTLLGITYVREQDLLGWHHHDFEGTVENVCVVPEGTEDVLYMVVNRTVSGRTVRYLERMASRTIQNVVDYIGMDAALTFDGRNTGATTMTLSGGSTWAYTETLTLTASSSYFTSSMVGNQIQLTGSDGQTIRVTLTGYTSGTVMTGKPNRTVPGSLQGIPVTTWARAVKQVTGLWHLEGKTLSVLGDGFVLASPYNDFYPSALVLNGTITLPHYASVIHAGLPFVSDLETLDMDTANAQSMADKAKNIQKVVLYLEESRGLWVGPEAPKATDPMLNNLTELKLRQDESYDDPVELATGPVEIILTTEWNSNGRVFMRQVDPLPVSVLAASAGGYIPIQGSY